MTTPAASGVRKRVHASESWLATSWLQPSSRRMEGGCWRLVPGRTVPCSGRCKLGSCYGAFSRTAQRCSRLQSPQTAKRWRQPHGMANCTFGGPTRAVAVPVSQALIRNPRCTWFSHQMAVASSRPASTMWHKSGTLNRQARGWSCAMATL
ncbi:unnamed protein product [Symbiodinium natans]|uniref:Uncharacterized protein n=1 Tax=Symbiodinium natans TaxID=878477 RepID=A0A812LUS1_9DINO|nr:unnamed protein product [Symbiodinium natans]